MKKNFNKWPNHFDCNGSRVSVTLFHTKRKNEGHGCKDKNAVAVLQFCSSAAARKEFLQEIKLQLQPSSSLQPGYYAGLDNSIWHFIKSFDKCNSDKTDDVDTRVCVGGGGGLRLGIIIMPNQNKVDICWGSVLSRHAKKWKPGNFVPLHYCCKKDRFIQNICLYW